MFVPGKCQARREHLYCTAWASLYCTLSLGCTIGEAVGWSQEFERDEIEGSVLVADGGVVAEHVRGKPGSHDGRPATVNSDDFVAALR